MLAAGAWFVMGRGAPRVDGPDGPPRQTGPSMPPPPLSQALYDNASEDMIQITAPQPGASVSPAIKITGRARGNWYFEASFPLEVLSPNGDVLIRVPVQAEGNWMTTEFVPFTTSVQLSPNYRGPATIVLHSDNASGLPEYDRSVSIPIVIE